MTLRLAAAAAAVPPAYRLRACRIASHGGRLTVGSHGARTALLVATADRRPAAGPAGHWPLSGSGRPAGVTARPHDSHTAGDGGLGA